jgi:hypothetical protein
MTMDGDPALIDGLASTVGDPAASELLTDVGALELTDVGAFESALAAMFRIESREALMEKSLMFHESVQPAPTTGQSGIASCASVKRQERLDGDGEGGSNRKT